MTVGGVKVATSAFGDITCKPYFQMYNVIKLTTSPLKSVAKHHALLRLTQQVNGIRNIHHSLVMQTKPTLS